MIHTGLVSVTFRKLTPEQIVALVSQAKLEGIEWGGDVHCPPGDLDTATRVAQLTREAGLVTAAYGSYYRVGQDETEKGSFEDVLATAKVLAAPAIRVWAGSCGSADADEACRRRIVEESRRIADLAAAENIVVAYEWHSGTLTDTNESAVTLLEEVGHENVMTYWQPALRWSFEDRLAGLQGVLDKLSHLHMYSWDDSEETLIRLPLEAGCEYWTEFLNAAASTGREHFAMLEFVRDDSPEAFLEDARTLRQWAQEI